MEHFVIIVNGFQPLSIITKHSILDVAAALGPPLIGSYVNPIKSHLVIKNHEIESKKSI